MVKSSQRLSLPLRAIMRRMIRRIGRRHLCHDPWQPDTQESTTRRYLLAYQRIVLPGLLLTLALFDPIQATSLKPLAVEKPLENGMGLELTVQPQVVATLVEDNASQEIELPLSVTESVTLEMERFDVVSPKLRLLVDGELDIGGRERLGVVLYRGTVRDEPNSRAYLALSSSGLVNGYVDIPGHKRHWIATPAESYRQGWPIVTVSPMETGWIDSESPLICGTTPELNVLEQITTDRTKSVETLNAAGPRVAIVAIEGDQSYFDVFGNITAAQEYVFHLLGAISDIYLRDLNVKLLVGSINLWPDGAEPYDPNNIAGFRSWVLENYSFNDVNLVELWTGRADLNYSGIAYVGGTCGDYGVGIQSRIAGSFPVPVNYPHLRNWDIYLVAHEMGHNFGSFHTHDGYDPPVDQCFGGQVVPSRGTIMSYCDNNPGSGLNIDLRFHSRVQEVIEDLLIAEGCHWFDCNDNNIDDVTDIQLGSSPDVNSNGIPDECEDCNNNSVLDPDDITGGMPDLNGNNIPDECESDCNGNVFPDQWEVTSMGAIDFNANNVPDECEPDCDNNGQADYNEIRSAIGFGQDLDVDRNLVLDICQDCNGNFVADWIDLERPNNLFVAFGGNDVREYHGASGVGVNTIRNRSLVEEPYDIAVGSDRRVYIASYGNDAIIRTDPADETWEELVPSGTGGLDGPTALLLRESDGALFVASSHTSSILKYNSSDGTFLETFVPSGSGGLDSPQAFTIGLNGNLFVCGADNTVREYSGSDGSYIREVVSAGEGGLNGPRGIVMHPNGNLLVTGFFNNAVLEFDGVTGTFVGQFNDGYGLVSPWGLCTGPSGNLFIVQSADPERVTEYNFTSGRSYHRPFAYGDNELVSPKGLAFMPPSPNDCNGNYIPDSCDIADGYSLDIDINGIPDECEVYDTDSDGVPDSLDNCITVANASQDDSDYDDVGDLCDACEGSDDNLDADRDGTPDDCDACPGYGDYADADSDGIPDGCDRCQGSDDAFDADADGAPDDCDMCEGFDDNLDADQDGLPDDCDACYACESSVILDHVDGLHNTDSILGNTPVTFRLRLRTHVADKQLSALSHSFRLYSPDGALWAPAVIDTAAINWQEQFGDDNPGFTFSYSSVPGPPADSFGISGAAASTSGGLNEDFDEVAFTISTSVENTQAGLTLCLDTSSVNWQWIWADEYPYQHHPFWPGERCFSIVASTCCVGITGNIDGDPEDAVDLGDLTKLIDYLFISFVEPDCLAEANVDGDPEGQVDLSDLTVLIDYLFISFTPPAVCL